MAKGFGVAALVFALIAIFTPFGIFVSAIAIIFAVISALAGDRIFATATALIALINTFFFSPSTWVLMSDHRGTVTIGIIIGATLPFVAMVLNAAGKTSYGRINLTSMGPTAGPFSEWPTYSQKEAIAEFWSDYGVYIIVAAVLIPVGVLKGPSWIKYLTSERNSGTHTVGNPTVPTVPVDIGPTAQVLLGTAGRVAGIRIVRSDQIPTTIQPGGPTAVGNDVQNGLHYVCYLGDVSACEAAFKEEANLERAATRNEAGSDLRAVPQVQIPQVQSPSVAAVPNPSQPSATRENTSYERKTSTWNFYGSRMYMTANGKRRRVFYDIPRDTLSSLGIANGSLLFEGELNGWDFAGEIAAYAPNCPVLKYAARGSLLPNGLRFFLVGKRPSRDESCGIVAWKDVTLNFDFVSQERELE
jgi:hypothetical protein